MTADRPEAAAASAAADRRDRHDRRVAVRVCATDLPGPIACRITPGRDVRVVNLSAAGMLVESTRPLFPGRTVKLHLQLDMPIAVQIDAPINVPIKEPIAVPINVPTPVPIDAPINGPTAVPIETPRVTLHGTVVRGHMAAVDRDRGATFVSGIAFERRLDFEHELTP